MLFAQDIAQRGVGEGTTGLPVGLHLIWGVNKFAPLVLNILAGTIAIVLIYRIFRKYEMGLLFTFVLLLAIIFVTPMPVLIFSGMEHLLHALLTILFAYLAAKLLAKQNLKFGESKLTLFSLSVLALLLTSIRYEGLFMIFVTTLLFLVRRRSLCALSVFVSGILPVAIYGTISTWASHRGEQSDPILICLQ